MWRCAPRGPDFHDAVMRATDGKGVNLVINTVGGTCSPNACAAMAFEGRLATVGYVDGVLMPTSTCRRCTRAG